MDRVDLRAVRHRALERVGESLFRQSDACAAHIAARGLSEQDERGGSSAFVEQVGQAIENRVPSLAMTVAGGLGREAAVAHLDFGAAVPGHEVDLDERLHARQAFDALFPHPCVDQALRTLDLAVASAHRVTGVVAGSHLDAPRTVDAGIDHGTGHRHPARAVPAR